MIPLSLAQIAAVTGGTVCGDPTLVVTGPAYLDSRSPHSGGLFVAIAGERVDGHSFAAHAHAVLGSRPTCRPTVVVPDPVVALGRLARHVVAAVAPTVLAVTGSHGKTTTKDYLAALLPGAVATPGNRNNELGVPLTAVQLKADNDFLVLEMGARGVGHLSYLCDIAPPHVGMVLGVGSAHVGVFGSLELTAAAKGELPAALPGDGVAVLNADDPRVAAMPTPARVLTFGVRGDVTWRNVCLDRLARPSFSLGYAGIWQPVRLQQSGAHQVVNACAAAAAALAVGEPLPAIAQRLSATESPSPMRMAVSQQDDGLIVIDDTYNANPESMRAALKALVSIGSRRGGRTIAVLGPMRELGTASAPAHAEVGAFARAHGVDILMAVGPAAHPAGGIGVSDIQSALTWLKDHLGRDDTVLVKASRGRRARHHRPRDHPGPVQNPGPDRATTITVTFRPPVALGRASGIGTPEPARRRPVSTDTAPSITERVACSPKRCKLKDPSPHWMPAAPALASIATSQFSNRPYETHLTIGGGPYSSPEPPLSRRTAIVLDVDSEPDGNTARSERSSSARRAASNGRK